MQKVCERATLLQMQCGHVYHEPCIAQWLTSHRTCPVCRKEMH